MTHKRNKFFFHCSSSECPQKTGTLKSLNVVIIQNDTACGYESMYRQIISNIDSIEYQNRSGHSATIMSEPQVADFSSADHILSVKKQWMLLKHLWSRGEKFRSG